MKPVDPELGLVERSDLVKGYEYEDKKYVIIEDRDLEAVKLETNHTLAIEAFVDEDEVDVIYQDTPYYLAPDGAMAEETFIVLREAMRQAGKVAIARLVLSSRERMVTIGAAREGDVRLHAAGAERGAGTSAYFDEIPDGKPDAEMLELAEALIKQKVTRFVAILVVLGIEARHLLLDQLFGQLSISASGLPTGMFAEIFRRAAHLVRVAQRADEHAVLARRRW